MVAQTLSLRAVPVTSKMAAKSANVSRYVESGAIQLAQARSIDAEYEYFEIMDNRADLHWDHGDGTAVSYTHLRAHET